MRKHIYILFIAILAACTAQNTPDVQPTTQAVATQSKSLKRGVAFNFQLTSDLPLLSPYISWDYNWGVTTTDISSTWFDSNEMDYCPMIWNNGYLSDMNKNKVRAYVQAHPTTKYLLGFNEPNLTDQANMIPSKAAETWPQVVALAKELNLKLVSPAMNYGTLAGYSDPIKWLDEFFSIDGIDLADIDAIAIHCYMPDATSLMNYIKRFEKYGKPIWLTEFCAWETNIASAEMQIAYMAEALNYLEQADMIERYAWFIPRYKTEGTYPYMQLINSQNPAGLTEAGKVYCYFSPFRKDEYLATTRMIHAGEYCAVSNNGIQVRPNLDAVGVELAGKEGLAIVSMSVGDTLTYHISVPKAASTMSIRYTSFASSIMEVMLDGYTLGYPSLASTNSISNWQPVALNAEIATGQHELKMILRSGSFRFSGFTIE